MVSPVRILIADDHAVVRQGLINIIEEDPELRVVAQTGDGAQVLELLEKLKPEIALIDIAMPNKSGLEILAEARKTKMPVRFIILTMYDDEAYFEEAFALGINGYLLKENSATELLACIRAVHQGKYYISADVSSYLVEQTKKTQNFQKRVPAFREFTPAERRVLRMIAETKNNREIAQGLSLSIRTVQNHRYKICQKLNLSGHNQLFKFALENKAYF